MKKGKLKPPIQRIPKERVSFNSLIRDVSKETGYTKKDVEDVIKTFIGHMVNNILLKRLVVIPGIGRIYPFIKRSRQVSVLNGDKFVRKMTLPSRFVLKLTPELSLAEDLKKLEVTAQEEKDLIRK